MTFQLVQPGRLCKSGNISDASTSSTAPPHLNASAGFALPPRRAWTPSARTSWCAHVCMRTWWHVFCCMFESVPVRVRVRLAPRDSA